MVSKTQAIEVICAARRLEAKYPALKELNSAICAIRPRYSAEYRCVDARSLDRRGRVIGGQPFISRAYPVPTGYEAPLPQLDSTMKEHARDGIGGGSIPSDLMPLDSHRYWMRFLSKAP
jgi:hypothetical protein